MMGWEGITQFPSLQIAPLFLFNLTWEIFSFSTWSRYGPRNKWPNDELRNKWPNEELRNKWPNEELRNKWPNEELAQRSRGTNEEFSGTHLHDPHNRQQEDTQEKAIVLKVDI
jgi:hypothetical protein